jgi:hypothetical protein
LDLSESKESKKTGLRHSWGSKHWKKLKFLIAAFRFLKKAGFFLIGARIKNPKILKLEDKQNLI